MSYQPTGSVDGSSYLTEYKIFLAKLDAIRFADTVNGVVIEAPFIYQGDRSNPYKVTKIKKHEQ